MVGLRSTVMDPFLARKDLADVHITGLIDALAAAAKRIGRAGNVVRERTPALYRATRESAVRRSGQERVRAQALRTIVRFQREDDGAEHAQ